MSTYQQNGKPSKFNETVKADTPRLVITFQRDANGDEKFQWGVVGSIPILSLIGCVIRVQNEVGTAQPPDEDHTCDVQALVIVWHKDERSCDYFTHPSIPVGPLVGMLELIKAVLVGSRVGQMTAAQQVGIVGPDGQPMRR